MKFANLFFPILLLSILIGNESNAIPAFARKYSMSCKVCHSPFPKVKPFGEDFAANGFQIPGKEPPRYTKKTGDDLLMLLREVPLAIRFELFGQYESGSEVEKDLKTPYNLKLMSGGNIFDDVSYYFYFYLSERGEVSGIEDAFVMFNNLFSEKNELDLLIGQYQVSDPLFKRELRLELEDYQVYRVRPGKSTVNLAYDRGLMLSYGLPTKTDLVFEVVNGNGISTSDIFDVDEYKNFMLRVSQEVLPIFRIGGFGYYGNEKPDTVDNELYMVGADLTLGNEKLELNAQYIFRSDSNPDFMNQLTRNHIITQGGFAEIIYSPKGYESRLTGYLLYNIIDSDLNQLDYSSYTAGISYLFARNFRMLGEYTYTDEPASSRLSFGIVTAF